MPATTPPKGKPTPKREDQRRARRRGLPEHSVIVRNAESGEPEVRDISGSGIVTPEDVPQDIVGYGSITLPSISTATDKE